MDSKRSRRRNRGRACGIRQRARMLAQCNRLLDAIDSGLRGYLLREREKLPQDILTLLGLEKDVALLTQEEVEREITVLAVYYKERYQSITSGNRSDRDIRTQAEELAQFSDGHLTVDEAEAVIRNNLAWQRNIDRFPPQPEEFRLTSNHSRLWY